MNKLDELKKYMQAHPELAQKLENASQEDGIQMILDTNLFSSQEEFLAALQNQKLSDQELGAVNGGRSFDDFISGCYDYSPRLNKKPPICGA